ncbi:MAG: hypothetical protein ACI4FO_08435, partial [Acutalibacteraceae bacterium]
KNISVVSSSPKHSILSFLRPGQGQAVRKRTVLPAKATPAARKSKNILLSNLVIFTTIQILTSPELLTREAPYGKIIYGVYKGVRAGVIKANGINATLFPDADQSSAIRRKHK